jgi:hypothetical protein
MEVPRILTPKQALPHVARVAQLPERSAEELVAMKVQKDGMARLAEALEPGLKLTKPDPDVPLDEDDCVEGFCMSLDAHHPPLDKPKSAYDVFQCKKCRSTEFKLHYNKVIKGEAL